MVSVIARLTVNPGKKNELFEMARPLIAATRAEQACISYELLDDRYDESRCVFVEKWTDKEGLARHLQTAHIKEWREKSAAFLGGDTVIEIYHSEKTSL